MESDASLSSNPNQVQVCFQPASASSPHLLLTSSSPLPRLLLDSSSPPSLFLLYSSALLRGEQMDAVGCGGGGGGAWRETKERREECSMGSPRLRGNARRRRCVTLTGEAKVFRRHLGGVGDKGDGGVGSGGCSGEICTKKLNKGKAEAPSPHRPCCLYKQTSVLDAFVVSSRRRLCFFSPTEKRTTSHSFLMRIRKHDTGVFRFVIFKLWGV